MFYDGCVCVLVDPTLVGFLLWGVSFCVLDLVSLVANLISFGARVAIVSISIALDSFLDFTFA